MNNYLVMGLAHEIKVSRKRMKEKKILKEEVQQEIEKSLSFDLNQNDWSETNDIILYYGYGKFTKFDIEPYFESSKCHK